MRRRGGLDISRAGKRGHVSNANPSSKGLSFSKSTRFSDSNVKRRSGSPMRKRRINKTALIIVAICVVSVALATFVGVMVYQQQLKNNVRPRVNFNAVEPLLTGKNSTSDRTWTLINKTNAESSEGERGTPTQLALVSTDTSNKIVVYLWIPANTRIFLTGSGYTTLAEAFEDSGETGLINGVKSFTKIDLSHYCELNESGLKMLAQKEAGITWPDSSHDKDSLTQAIYNSATSSSSEQLKTHASTIDKYVASDTGYDGILKMLKSLQGMNVSENYSGVTMPATEENYDNSKCSVVDQAQWNSIIERVANGLSPVASETEIANNERIRSSTRVTVWNGAGVSGIANDCVNELKKYGWKIESQGNAAQFVYDETLIVYQSSSKKNAAKLLAADLGQGRVIESAYRYTFAGDLLIVVGKDYQPH